MWQDAKTIEHVDVIWFQKMLIKSNLQINRICHDDVGFHVTINLLYYKVNNGRKNIGWKMTKLNLRNKYLKRMNGDKYCIESTWWTVRHKLKEEIHPHCCVSLHEECPQHHGLKGHLGTTLGTCGAIGDYCVSEGPRHWERLPFMETKSYKDKAMSIG